MTSDDRPTSTTSSIPDVHQHMKKGHGADIATILNIEGSNMTLQTLQSRYPWPDSPPDVPVDLMGWLASETADALKARLTPDTKLVVECGSWLGVSATAILNNAPNANLVCIDTWQGSPEHHREPGWSKYLPTLYETFIRNMWDYRERVIPLRADSLVGLGEVFAAGLVPDLVYLDSAHECGRVTAELALCREFWPAAIVVGDDLSHGVVRAAAENHAALFGRTMHDHGAAFSFDPTVK